MANRKAAETRPSQDPASSSDNDPDLRTVAINREALISLCFYGGSSKTQPLFRIFRKAQQRVGTVPAPSLKTPEEVGTTPCLLDIQGWLDSIQNAAHPDAELMSQCYTVLASRVSPDYKRSVIEED